MSIAKSIHPTSVLLMALCVLALPQSAAAQAPPVEDKAPLHVVTYIDVFPMFAADTAKALQDFAAASAKDPGFVRIDILRDVDRTNHFAVTEVWRTRKEYEAHLGQAHTKQFREKIQAGLGSPFDERLYHKLP